jgi:hypothetical protein
MCKMKLLKMSIIRKGLVFTILKSTEKYINVLRTQNKVHGNQCRFLFLEEPLPCYKNKEESC